MVIEGLGDSQVLSAEGNEFRLDRLEDFIVFQRRKSREYICCIYIILGVYRLLQRGQGGINKYIR